MGNIKLKISVCVTVFNESEETIKKLTSALNSQTLKPDEIIIVDASNYRLPRRITPRNDTGINYELISKTGVSRARGRNIAIKKARNEIIAITDAGCVPHRDWLARLTEPLDPSSQGYDEASVVAGGYKMIAKNSFEKAESVFLGVNEKDIDKNFMPSARSMAFTKTIWKKAGGFPEELRNTAEDTVFDVRLLNAGAKFVVVKNAIVDWYMPSSIKNFYLKIKNYARGDAQSGIWWHPIKKWETHNIKILNIFLRYIIASILIFSGLFVYLTICLFAYLAYAYRKAGLWGIVLQFVSDFAGIIGFSHGILQTGLKWD